jgi:predicted DCC family thiol-disulfide oxidoreductase YuxK
MRTLTVLYDADCGLCAKSRTWVQRQHAYFPVEFLPQGSAESVRRYPGVTTTSPPLELVVIDDTGGVYRDDKAWLMILYALRRYRPLAMRLARPGFHGLARRAYHLVSRNRYRLSSRLGWSADVELRRELVGAHEPLRCHSGLEGVKRFVHGFNAGSDTGQQRDAGDRG